MSTVSAAASLGDAARLLFLVSVNLSRFQLRSVWQLQKLDRDLQRLDQDLQDFGPGSADSGRVAGFVCVFAAAASGVVSPNERCALENPTS